MASWRTEPQRVASTWTAYRQSQPDWPALYHGAGEPRPSQTSGRWHRQGEGYAQYLSLEPQGAWAELVRFEAIRGSGRAREYRRNLWVARVTEREVADLSTFDAYAAAGLDPQVAVGDHTAAQALAHDLRDAGYRGVLSPSAALTGVVNLTIFGERYEKVLSGGLDSWSNPDPGVWIPVSLAAEDASPPTALLLETTFAGAPHAGYEAWLAGRG